MKTFNTMLLLILVSHVTQLIAVTIVECEDNQGERTFQASCPPGTMQVNAREIHTGTSPVTVSDTAMVGATLYVVPECDPCQDVREFLQARNVNVTVKDVSVEQAMQEELQALTGTLRAPVTQIGDAIIFGYSRSELTTALAAVGYAEPD